MKEREGDVIIYCVILPANVGEVGCTVHAVVAHIGAVPFAFMLVGQ